MKESVLDVLKFLFEKSFDSDCTLPIPDRDTLKVELTTAGFPSMQVDSALTWLDALAADTDRPIILPTTSAIRVFDKREAAHLDIECRNYILFLERAGILDAARRELVIDRLLALDGDGIELEQVRWVVLLVLFAQDEQELPLARMEGLVFDHPLREVH